MSSDVAENTAAYRALVRDRFEGQVREVNSHYPEEISVRMDWQEIATFDESLADQFLDAPEAAREQTVEAIAEWDAVDIPEVVVRVNNIPEEYHFRVGKQRTYHLGNLITVEGKVVEMEGVKPFARTAALECHNCGTMHHVPQSYGRMMEPPECKGCEKRGTTMLFRREQSDLIDYRKVILQRADTNLDDDPPTLVIYLTQDLVDRIGPGDLVELVGYYDTGMLQKQSVVETYLDTWDIESQQEDVVADKLDPGDIEDRVQEAVGDLEDADPSSFGADRTEVIERVTADGIREQEVEAALDRLMDRNEVSEISGDTLMVQ